MPYGSYQVQAYTNSKHFKSKMENFPGTAHTDWHLEYITLPKLWTVQTSHNQTGLYPSPFTATVISTEH